MDIPIRVTLWCGFPEDRRFSMDVYADHLSRGLREVDLPECQVHRHTPHIPRRLGRGPWAMRLARYVGYPLQVRNDGTDVHHIMEQGYAHLLHVLDPARTVVTVHDVMPVVRWRGGIPTVPAGRRPWLNLVSSRALRRAAQVIAISHNTRNDLIHFCDCDPDKIVVIYHGIEPSYRVLSPTEREQVRKKWRFPSDATFRVLMIGSSYYKNQRVALRAFDKLRRSVGVKLELVGVSTSSKVWSESIRKLGLAGWVREIKDVPRDEMVEVYNCVDLLLFPSLYEGFGRPPVEAMACGIPAVVSNASALPEAVGHAGLMCDPEDDEALAEQMYVALFDRTRRNTLIEKGLAWSKQFTWQNAARQTAAVYGKVVRG